MASSAQRYPSWRRSRSLTSRRRWVCQSSASGESHPSAVRLALIRSSPQFNETVWIKADHQRVGEATENDERLLGFLDESLKKYGSNCAAFITFGSYSWPKHRMELITHLLESLLEVEPIVPFIFATPAPVSREGDTKIPDELIKKVEESGRGIITGWAPQVRILQHEATGMMLVSADGRIVGSS